MKTKTIGFIPAAPGTSLIAYLREQPEDSALAPNEPAVTPHHAVVVGWRVISTKSLTWTVPVFFPSYDLEFESYVVVFPDGRMVGNNGDNGAESMITDLEAFATAAGAAAADAAAKLRIGDDLRDQNARLFQRRRVLRQILPTSRLAAIRPRSLKP